MLEKNKINLVCVGGVGETFLQFLNSGKDDAQSLNTLLIKPSDEIEQQKKLGSNDFAKLIFCVLGASSSNNVLQIKSLFDHNPTLWQKTHFILIHPFNFEGEEKSKTAQDFSEFVTFQGSKKTDFRNQDLFKHIDKNAKFEDGFKIMNKWILGVIEQRKDL